VDAALEVEVAAPDGTPVTPGDVVMRIRGGAVSLLTAERTALNFLQRLSGVATVTHRYVRRWRGRVRASSTPARRRRGCGRWRRPRWSRRRDQSPPGPHDMVMIKDNHIAAAGGSPRRWRRSSHNDRGLRVEVETTDLDEVDQALAAGVDRIMFDNMPVPLLRARWRRSGGGRRPAGDRGVRRDHAGHHPRRCGNGGGLHLRWRADPLRARARSITAAPGVVSAGRADAWEGATAATLAAAWGVPAVHLFETVGSTNDAARTLADAGAPHGSVVLADAQTAGRGRSGRGWSSSPGLGVWMSMVVRPVASPAPGLLPILVGIAAAEALDPFVQPLRTGIKWPNDLHLAGRKLAGILCEGSWAAGIPAPWSPASA
jgi:hypothetical protein